MCGPSLPLPAHSFYSSYEFFFRILLFTCKKSSIGLGHCLASVLPGAPTSPSVHEELREAVRGLDGFYWTLAWVYMSLFESLKAPPEAPKKI